MPRFSICIPSYDDAKYLPSCIDSVLAQAFSDFEIIVVDDGSNDGTRAILKSYSEKDRRVKPIIKEQNEGTHLGRMSSAQACAGEYVIFLDSDDELLSGCLEQIDEALSSESCDVLHFGIEAVGSNVSEKEREDFERYINTPIETLVGPEIMNSIFSTDGNFRQDWRITQRAFSRELVKCAFASMTKERMGRAEDGYEAFVLLAHAKRQITRNDIVCLKYYYGRGQNSATELNVSSFIQSASGFWSAISHANAFSGSFEEWDLADCVQGFKNKSLELLFNDWYIRVPDQKKIEAAYSSADFIGNLDVAIQLIRCSRDKAYEAWVNDDPYSENESYRTWYKAAMDLAGNEGSCSPTYMTLRKTAKRHFSDLQRRTRKIKYDEQSIRIFVSTHKKVDLFDSNILQPVQVGSAQAASRYSWALHDDQGDNISALNPMYCELTTQYWAWKNTDSDYVGFCHYRRYFDFNPMSHEENPYGEIIEDAINASSQEKYLLNDDVINQTVRNYDVITTRCNDIRSFMDEEATIRSHYDTAPHLHVCDLDAVMDIVVERDPSYAEDVTSFLSGHVARFCNMFIMRRDIFDDYCSWLFPILEEFSNRADMSRYSKEGLRTPGHLSERLLNVYLNHHLRTGCEWKIGELQCVHFLRPDYNPEMKMIADPDDRRQVIPVVLAADNNYVPMLTTTVFSALKNASKDYRYDVVILHRDISWENKEIIKGFLSQFEGANLRFCDVTDIVSKYNLTTNNPHISIETYYRFLIQELLPFYDKVLYIDSDLIVNGDIAELFSTDLGNNLLAAVPDIDFAGNVNYKDGNRERYARDVLGLSDPFSYFQAGVLVINTREMRRTHSMDEWLEYASDDSLIYNDQDVLNAHCKGRVSYLNYEWNVMTDCGGRISSVFSFAPAQMFDSYLRSRSCEKIVHYAGFEKPWTHRSCDRFELYWEYARQTPFAEKLLSLLNKVELPPPPSTPPLMAHEQAISSDNSLRKIIDPLLPLGSARREVVKSAVRLIRGRD